MTLLKNTVTISWGFNTNKKDRFNKYSIGIYLTDEIRNAIKDAFAKKGLTPDQHILAKLEKSQLTISSDTPIKKNPPEQALERDTIAQMVWTVSPYKLTQPTANGGYSLGIKPILIEQEDQLTAAMKLLGIPEDQWGAIRGTAQEALKEEDPFK